MCQLRLRKKGMGLDNRRNDHCVSPNPNQDEILINLGTMIILIAPVSLNRDASITLQCQSVPRSWTPLKVRSDTALPRGQCASLIGHTVNERRKQSYDERQSPCHDIRRCIFYPVERWFPRGDSQSPNYSHRGA